MNEAVGVKVTWQNQDGNTYDEKLGAVLASSAIPDVVVVPGWNLMRQDTQRHHRQVRRPRPVPLRRQGQGLPEPRGRSPPTPGSAPSSAASCARIPMPAPYVTEHRALLPQGHLRQEGLRASRRVADEFLSWAKEATDAKAKVWACGDMKWTAFNIFGVLPGSDKALWLEHRSTASWSTASRPTSTSKPWSGRASCYAAGVVHPDAKARQGQRRRRQPVHRRPVPRLQQRHLRLVRPDGRTGHPEPRLRDRGHGHLRPRRRRPHLWATQPASIFAFVSKKASEAADQGRAGRSPTSAPRRTAPRSACSPTTASRARTTRSRTACRSRTTKGNHEVNGAYDYTGEPGRRTIAHPDFPEVAKGQVEWQQRMGAFTKKTSFYGMTHHRAQPLDQPRQRLRAAGGRHRPRPQEDQRHAAGRRPTGRARAATSCATGTRSCSTRTARGELTRRLRQGEGRVPQHGASAQGRGEDAEETAGDVRRRHRAPAAGQTARAGKLGLRLRFRRDRTLILMTLPAVVLVLVFNYVPILGNVVAFQDYDPYLSDNGFVADLPQPLGRLRAVPADLRGLGRSGTRCRTPSCCSSSSSCCSSRSRSLLALLINSVVRPRVRAVAQAIMYLPHFFSWVLVVTVFQQIFGGAGIIAQTLRAARLRRLRPDDQPGDLQVPGHRAERLEGRRLGHHRLPRRAGRGQPRTCTRPPRWTAPAAGAACGTSRCPPCAR